AAGDLLRQRTVRGGRAAGGRRHVAVEEAQTVAARHRCRLAREARPVQRREQEIARAVAREDAARPVPAVGGGSQPDDQEPSRGIAPARHGAAPVLLILEAPDLDRGDLAAPGAQPRAALARHHVARHARERVAGGRVRPYDAVGEEGSHDGGSGRELQRRLPPAAAVGARRVRASVVRAAAARLAGLAVSAGALAAAGTARGPFWARLAFSASMRSMICPFGASGAAAEVTSCPWTLRWMAPW